MFEPELKRRTSSIIITTTPLLQRTSRTTSDALPRGGMKSISVTSPSAHSNVVSRMSVSLRYARLIALGLSFGAISHRPLSLVPSSAAKQASESKDGQHSQSIEPSRLTSAAVRQSPISA